jgi:hypothetical protein
MITVEIPMAFHGGMTQKDVVKNIVLSMMNGQEVAEIRRELVKILCNCEDYEDTDMEDIYSEVDALIDIAKATDTRNIPVYPIPATGKYELYQMVGNTEIIRAMFRGTEADVSTHVERHNERMSFLYYGYNLMHYRQG